MWRLTWRLASIGIPLEFQSEVPPEELLKRIRQRTVWRALRSRKQSEQVAFRLHRDHLVTYVARLSFRALAHPVFYAHLDTTDARTHIKGRFLFQKLVRVAVWLTVVFALIFEGVWIRRCTLAVLDGLPWDQSIGYFTMLVPSVVVVAVVYMVLSRFAAANAQDLATLTDELKAIATQ